MAAAKGVEINPAELALILEALADAAFYRDSRSRVLSSAVKRSRRGSPSSGKLPASSTGNEANSTDVHRIKAREYVSLRLRLGSGR